MHNLPAFDTFLDNRKEQRKSYDRLQEVLDRRETLMMSPFVIFLSAEQYRQMEKQIGIDKSLIPADDPYAKMKGIIKTCKDKSKELWYVVGIEDLHNITLKQFVYSLAGSKMNEKGRITK